MIILANIRGVNRAERAAAALWVQCETMCTSMQMGWVVATKMRVIKLQGAADPGARRAFAWLVLLASGVVAVANVPLLLPRAADAIARALSNDGGVAREFRRLIWVLAIHCQLRVVAGACGALRLEPLPSLQR